MLSSVLTDFLAKPSGPVLIAAVAVLVVAYYFWNRRNILPGPRGLPFFGLWPYLTDDKCHLQLEEIGKTYGDLYSFKFLGNLFINLGSAKAMREAHVQKADCFSERFTSFNVIVYMQEEGVVIANGETWKTLRRFYLQGFKDYAMPAMKHTHDGPIYDQLKETIKEIRASNGKPMNIIDPLTVRCTCTMRKALFGDHGSKDDEMTEMLKVFTVALDGMSGVQLLLIGWFARNVLYRFVPRYRAVLATFDVMDRHLYNIIRRIEANFDESHPTCIVESYYKERNERRRKKDPTAAHFTDRSLVSSLAQFVGDGIFTVALFIGCYLNALIEHPQEQDKIYEEVVNVIGTDRIPTLDDKSRMPYTSAFMLEVARIVNFFPLFPSLECTKETTIRGYRIPKGSITLLNIWQSHRDSSAYQNPDKFDPSRYLPAPGKPKPEPPVNFGMGKRGCMGEGFVTLQSFLFLTTIVQNFRLKEPPSSTKKSSMFLMTGELEVCFIPRSEK